MIQTTHVRQVRERWRRSRGTAAAIVLLIALGGGASGLAVTLSAGILSNPLGAGSPHQLVAIENGFPSLAGDLRDANAFLDFAPLMRGFDRLGAYSQHDGGANLAVDGVLVRARGAEVTPGFFETLQIPLAHGRDIAQFELPPGRNRVVILSEPLAGQLFGDPSRATGRRVQINDIPFDVIGVIRRSFRFPHGATFWIPISLHNRVFRGHAVAYGLFGRLSPGITLTAAREELGSLPERAAGIAPGSWLTRRKIALQPMSDLVVGKSRRSIQLLVGALLLVWFATAANVAMLLVTRNASRSQEFAIRWALGASRGRFLRDSSLEALGLALTSGAIASAVVYVGLDVLAGIVPDDFGGSITEPPTIASLAAVWIMASVAATLVIAPAARWEHRVLEAQTALRDGGRAPVLRGRRLGAGIQAAVAVLLVAATFTIARTIRDLQRQELGFNPDGGMAFAITLPGTTDKPLPLTPDVWNRVIDRVRLLPGVEAAGAATAVPLVRSDAVSLLYSVVGERSPKTFAERFALVVGVTAGYAEAMGFRLLEGRLFGPQDMAGNTPVAIVNRALADKYGGISRVLGKRLDVTSHGGTPEIVGVVENVRHFGPGAEMATQMLGHIYLPHPQFGGRLVAVAVRHTGPADIVARGIRAVAAQEQSGMVVYDLKPMSAAVRESSRPQYLLSWLLLVFAVIALSLASVGTYAVVAQFVATRKREIAVRRALGARHGSLLSMLVANGIVPASIGAAAGIAGTFLLLRFGSTAVPGMRAPAVTDCVAAVLTVLMMAGLASLFSSVTALRIDPARVLRD